ncbi:xaa-pro dipeptidase app [Rhizodiscina lignyota]|uniref:Xaa-Pro aminopeptidase n=1 Tax=Rhizodiscina lignyota TaxID=1504668 RepID=A0A9P4ICZ4_9PEZI|nr:xaa-pro dipeptidase app [Rhizodiscina lignyota]
MTSSLRLLSSATRVRRRCIRPLCGSLLKTAQRQTRGLVSAAELQFGQPLHETHPHLLQPGELTPGITALEYAQRRERIAKALPANSIAILSASDLKYRSGVVFYEYHQDADFFYLTGFNEPEALAIIANHGTEGDYTFHLYVRPKDTKAELWEGARSGIQAAQDVFNADEVGDIANIPKILPDIINSARHVFTDIPTTLPDASSKFNGQYLNGLAHWRANSLPSLLQKSDKLTLHPLRKPMNELRVRKSEAEIANMRRVGKASALAFTEAMRNHFTTEKELGAFLDYKFKLNGCDGTAYVPVVAGGRNALSIHYVRNDDVLRDENLVLVDAGGEFGGYIADITRTFPVDASKKFTKAQSDLYAAVLEPQKKVVDLCHSNANLCLDDLHRVAESSLRDNLKALGFDMSNDAISVLFPHHVGHHIGLDVHDAPGFSRREKLVSGMCVTVEPGVYVPDDKRWPKHFRNIGIRIEDSVCIQEEHPMVLTAEAVKEIDDIEALGQSMT